MASVSVYLNFQNQTEAAFEFYKQVFKTEYSGDGLMRMRDVPPQEGYPELSEEEKNLVMHVTLPITGGFELMGSDVPESMGVKVSKGNNTYINVMPDTRKEADRLFSELSAGGEVEMEMKEMFWGDYFGSFKDKFGICWMINCSAKE